MIKSYVPCKNTGGIVMKEMYHNLMKVGCFLKSTDCQLDSQFVLFSYEAGENGRKDEINMLNACESFHDGISINERVYMKAMPIDRFDPCKNIIGPIFESDKKTFEWYKKHSLNGEDNPIEKLKAKWDR